MSSDNEKVFTKENLDLYLRELAKEFRRLNGKNMPAEIILIGGAAIVANYGFRDMTVDIDAVIRASSAMKDAINRVGDRYGLPNGWLNGDFVQTSSYSPKLDEHSEYYKTFSNIVTVRTIRAEYLIAMKLCAGRQYKNDLSDILGILAEHEKNNVPITYADIDRAVRELYGSWKVISEDSQAFITRVMEQGNYESLYASVRGEEARAKDALISFEKSYPDVLNERNANEIIRQAAEKREARASVLEKLRAAQQREQKPQTEDGEKSVRNGDDMR